MFKNSNSKPKYSIRKYSIGAASALIGFMALTSGHTAQADEAQALTDGNVSPNQTQVPQSSQSVSLASSEPQVAETTEVAKTPILPQSPPQAEPVESVIQPGSARETQSSADLKVETQVLTNASGNQGQTYATDETGAKFPYTSQAAEEAHLENGATVQQSTDMESTAVEATNQTYVELPQKDAAVTFQVTQPANALNVRYTIPDGELGELDVQVNGTSVGSLDLSSHSAWQYLKGDHEYDQPVEGGSARFRFDETRLLLNDVQLKAGDKLSLVKKRDDQVAYGIDLIELEQAPEPIAQGENSINILDKGASANDDGDDTAALLAAVDEAKATGKSIYIPQGRFNFDKQINIEADNLKISGAGIWHTTLHFTSDKRYGGGIVFGHNSNGIELSDFYMDSNLTSRYNEDAQYKAISGTLGKDSKIHDVWVQHFEVGMWIGDYDQTGNMKYTDGLLVENARIRNNLADGINFAQGTKNSTVQNSNIRGNGDDGLAIWSSISDGTNAAIEENNKFLNNTIEAGWRAAGIGIFGGKGHEVAGNLIKDTFAGAGIRVNTVFAGHNFDLNDSGIKIHDNTLLRTGTTNDLYHLHRGAIDFQQVRGTIKNIDVYDNKLLNTLTGSAITKNFEMGESGNNEIRLANNVIDNAAKIQGNNQLTPTDVIADNHSQPQAESETDHAVSISESSIVTPVPVSNSSAQDSSSEVSVTTSTSDSASLAPEFSEVEETSAAPSPLSETSSEVANSEVSEEVASSETDQVESTASVLTSENTVDSTEEASSSSESTSSEVEETSATPSPLSEASSEAANSEISSDSSASDSTSLAPEFSEVEETSATPSPLSETSSEAPTSTVSKEVASSEVEESSDSQSVYSEATSETSISEVRSESGQSEVSSEIDSQTAKSDSIDKVSESSALSDDENTPDSENVTKESISEEGASDIQASEQLSISDTVWDSHSTLDASSELPSSTSQVTVVETSETVSKDHFDEKQNDPIEEVGSEALKSGSTSQVTVELSETLVSLTSSEALSQVTDSQMFKPNMVKTITSQLMSETVLANSLTNERPVQALASELMARLATDALTSVAATVSSSEGVLQEVASELAQVADSTEEADSKEDKLSSKLVAGTMASKHQSKESQDDEKAPGLQKLFIVGIGVAAALSLSYLGVQVKKSRK